MNEMLHPTPLAGDAHGRPLRALRISVTDKCNLRCRYCMPRQSYEWLPREDILTLEENARLVGVFADLGVTKTRITGGEPLLRRNLSAFIRLAAKRVEVALTTNGLTLAERAKRLRAAGLARVTVSLDTLRPERFATLTGRDLLSHVLAGIDAAVAAGFENTKLNSVVMRGFNLDELTDLLAFGQKAKVEVRFIEYMDVAGATDWSPDQVVPRDEILARLAAHFGSIVEVPSAPAAPAKKYALADGTEFGIIASTTQPFCSTCDRARITADGMLYTCLHTGDGVDLRGPLRSTTADEAVRQIIIDAWKVRSARGAEERLSQKEPQTMARQCQADPHREMHTRGG